MVNEKMSGLDESSSLMSGLTDAEQRVMDRLVAAWSAFVHLPQNRDEDLDQFMRAIHSAQQVLALRVVRRRYPEYWR